MLYKIYYRKKGFWLKRGLQNISEESDIVHLTSKRMYAGLSGNTQGDSEFVENDFEKRF